MHETSKVRYVLISAYLLQLYFRLDSISPIVFTKVWNCVKIRTRHSSHPVYKSAFKVH